MASPNITPPPASAPGAKITRHELAQHLRLSLRYVDELTRNGTLPFYKIGKSIRYELAEVETAMRERFHVQAKARKQPTSGTKAHASR